jgi:hypothetical protein
MNTTELKDAFTALLKEYYANGIYVKLESDTNMSSFYPDLMLCEHAQGFVNKSGQRALDILFDLPEALKAIEEKKAQEDLEGKAWQLEQAGYKVTLPGEIVT